MFEEYQPKTYSANSIPDDKCAVAIRKGPNKSFLLVFRLGSQVAKALGWVKGDKVSIFFGLENDLGKVRIEAAAVGRRACNVVGSPDKGYRIMAGHFPVEYPRGVYTQQLVSHEVLEARTDRCPRLIMTLPPSIYRKNRKAA